MAVVPGCNLPTCRAIALLVVAAAMLLLLMLMLFRVERELAEEKKSVESRNSPNEAVICMLRLFCVLCAVPSIRHSPFSF